MSSCFRAGHLSTGSLRSITWLQIEENPGRWPDSIDSGYAKNQLDSERAHNRLVANHAMSELLMLRDGERVGSGQEGEQDDGVGPGEGCDRDGLTGRADLLGQLA